MGDFRHSGREMAGALGSTPFSAYSNAEIYQRGSDVSVTNGREGESI